MVIDDLGELAKVVGCLWTRTKPKGLKSSRAAGLVWGGGQRKAKAR